MRSPHVGSTDTPAVAEAILRSGSSETGVHARPSIIMSSPGVLVLSAVSIGSLPGINGSVISVDISGIIGVDSVLFITVSIHHFVVSLGGVLGLGLAGLNHGL